MGCPGDNGTDAGNRDRVGHPRDPAPAVTSRDPKHLNPELQWRWAKMLMVWRDKHPDGPRLFLTCTYRPPAEQARLYRQGRTEPGPKVTGADAGQSLHNYLPAYALDFGFQQAGEYLARPEHLPMYHEVGEHAERLGLEWGGRWRMRDYTHVQAALFTWQQAQQGHEPKWAGAGQ